MKIFLITKKVTLVVAFLLLFIFPVLADECALPSYDLPNHDEIKAEVNSLIETDALGKIKASVLQKVKTCVSRSNGYIQITSENALKIYQLIEAAAKTIGVDVPCKVYLNIGHSLNLNCCNAFVSKNYRGEIYLSLGSKLLCELTPQETKAILEHEFMHIKDKLLAKLEPKGFEIGILGGCLGGIIVAELHICMDAKKSQKHLALAALVATPLFVFLSWKILKRILANLNEIFSISKDLEKNADLHVSSKADMVSALKKVLAMLIVETIKYYPHFTDPKIISLLEVDINSALIKNIEDGKLDFSDPMHPSLQARLKYLNEDDYDDDMSSSENLQDAEICEPAVVA